MSGMGVVVVRQYLQVPSEIAIERVSTIIFPARFLESVRAL